MRGLLDLCSLKMLFAASEIGILHAERRKSLDEPNDAEGHFKRMMRRSSKGICTHFFL